MGTWNDVKAYVRQNFKTEDLGDGLKLVFGLDGGRSQLVFLYQTGAWVTVASPISPIEKVDANMALVTSAMGTAPGGLAIDSGLVIYACTLYIDSIQGPELIEAIELVTLAVDGIEKELGLGDDW
ncbi:MAG: hypothetical protein WCP26_12935 [Actinomycetes bacterium]